MYDFFISHASEDKDGVARPLAYELQNRGYKVWYDEFILKLGDSIRQAIDRGLADSKYGIVILSSRFFEKNWTSAELDALFAMQMGSTGKILPVWHNLESSDMVSRSPLLSGLRGIATTQGITAVVDEIVRAVETAMEPSQLGETFDIASLTNQLQASHFVHWNLTLDVNSLATYSIPEIHKLFQRFMITVEPYPGIRVPIPEAFLNSNRQDTSDQTQLVYRTRDLLPYYSNAFQYTMAVLKPRFVMYSSIELDSKKQIPIRLPNLVRDVIALFVVLERIHAAESLESWCKSP